MPRRVEVFKSGKYEYVRVCESYVNEEGKPRTRIIQSFGRLETCIANDPNFVEKLKEQTAIHNAREKEFRQEVAKEKARELLEKWRLNAAEGENEDKGSCPKVNVASALLRQVWKIFGLQYLFSYLQKKTKIEYSYDKSVYLLCEQRILAPCSKKKTYTNRYNSAYNFSEIDQLSILYKVLDRLSEDKETIVKHLSGKLAKLAGGKVEASMYDLTTYSFESQKTSDLLNFGMSKDHKSNEVQVVLGLAIDKNGLPLNYELFSGNTSEFKTMLPVISQLKKTHRCEKLIVVADRGLNSNENLLTLQEIGCDFVIAQKMRNCSQDKKEEILDSKNWQKKICGNNGELLAQYKSIKVSKKLYETEINQKTGRKKNGKFIKELETNWIISYSAARAENDLKEQKRAIEKAEKALKKNPTGKMSNGYSKYIKTPKVLGEAKINFKKIQDDAKWHGYYAICTSLETDDFEYIVDLYHNLWRIEECFRTSKSQLETRPCFVWTDEHIKGHFLSCYISLAMEKYIHYVCRQKNIEGATTETICEALRKAEVAQAPLGGGQILYLKLYEEGLFDRIGELFGLTSLNKYEMKETLRKKLHLYEHPVCKSVV